jgi:hypothetical protein
MQLHLMKTRTNLSDNGYTLEDQEEIYNTLLEEVYANPRKYLDNLESFTTFRVSWGNYHGNPITLPYKYAKKYPKTKSFIKSPTTI